MSGLGVPELRNALLLFGPIGVPELLIILVIVALIFGAGRLPQLGKGIGEGIRNFKHSIRGEPDEDDTKK